MDNNIGFLMNYLSVMGWIVQRTVRDGL